MIINKILPTSSAKHSLLSKPIKRVAPYILGLGLMVSGAAKANNLKSDVYQKENIEQVSVAEDAKDKHLLGELILSVGLLTYVGLGLYSQLSKNKDNNQGNTEKA